MKIVQKYEEYRARGWATIKEKQEIESWYNQYRGLDGNGVVKVLMERFEALANSEEEYLASTASFAHHASVYQKG
jgi:hypothetical protein